MRISDWSSDVCSSDLDDIQIGVTVHEADHGLIEYCCQTRFAGAQRLFGGFLAGYHLYGADNDRLVGGRPDMARGHSSPCGSAVRLNDTAGAGERRSGEGRVGEEGGSTCGSRWVPCH